MARMKHSKNKPVTFSSAFDLSLLLIGFIKIILIVFINPVTIKQIVFSYFIAVNGTVRINDFF
jgi:hypothetical protein